jgi:hypothetical protein
MTLSLKVVRHNADSVGHHAHPVQTGLTVGEDNVPVHEVAIHHATRSSMRTRFSGGGGRWTRQPTTRPARWVVAGPL